LSRGLHGTSSRAQGDPADAVFYIQKGKVKINVVSEQGKEAVVAILGTNDFFGEGCLAAQVQRIAMVRTMTECIIVRLDKDAIIHVIHQESFSEMFICASPEPDYPRRSRPRRSDVQFERKASCPDAPAVGELWQVRQAGTDHRENQPGDACRDDRHYPIPRKFLHEQI
jgi:Cyclic nucleotide-binding domain